MITVRLEGWYLVMCMVNLLPSLWLKVHSYPECIGEVITRYKSTGAESRMLSRQWELHHCSIVYTMTLVDLRLVVIRYHFFQFRYDIDVDVDLMELRAHLTITLIKSIIYSNF